ncbi:MAG: hypothetical protein RBQ91_00715 [Acholeplasma sp.]|nr:hypothetical protein [Acholeplasma sp.]
MKHLKGFWRTYQQDLKQFKEFEAMLSFKMWLFHGIVPFLVLVLGYLPILLVGVNLSIFVNLQKTLIVLLMLSLVSLPYLYYSLKYLLIKHYQKSLIFVKINRLVIVKGTYFLPFVVGIWIYVLVKYWRFLP